MTRRLKPEEAAQRVGERGSDGRFPEGSVNAAVESALAASVERPTG
jgi:hypothetical protein